MKQAKAADPIRSRRISLVATALLVLAGWVLWRWLAPPPRQSAEVEPTPGATRPRPTAVAAGYPGIAGHPPAASPAQTRPRLPTPTPWPTVTPEPTPAYAAALPDGAVIDWDKVQASWTFDGGQREGLAGQLAAVPYRLDGSLGVGVLAREGETGFKRLWALSDVTDLPARPEAVSIDGVVSRAGSRLPVIVVQHGDSATALVLSATRQAVQLRYRLPWPGDLETRATLEELDLTGDEQTEVILSSLTEDRAKLRTAVFRLDPGGSAAPLAETDGRLQAADVDGDGKLELLDVTTPGRARLRRWDGSAFVEAGEHTEPPVPTPIPVADGRLPALPADLFLLRRASLWRWPKAGGSLVKVADLGVCTDQAPCDSIEVADDGTLVVSPSVDREKYPAFRVFGPDGSAAREIPVPHEVTIPYPGDVPWDLSTDGRHLVYLRYIRPPDAPDQVRDSDPKPAEVVVVDLAAGGQERVVATCPVTPPASAEHGAMGCLPYVAVSPDGAKAAYANGEALWVVDLAGGEPRAVIPQWFGPTEMDAKVYWPESWSPDGRSLRVSQGGWEGRVSGLVAVETGAYAEIPFTAVYGGPWSSFAWAPDGRGLVHARSLDYGEAPTALFRVDVEDPAHPKALLPMLDAGNTLSLFAPAVAAVGSIRYISRHGRADLFRGNGVFAIGADGQGWRRLAELPPWLEGEDSGIVGGSAAWAPGAGAWAFWNDVPAGEPFLVGTGDGGTVWDATGMLSDARGLVWGQ